MLFSPIYSLSVILYLVASTILIFFQSSVPVWMAVIPAALLMAVVLVAIYVLYQRVLEHEKSIEQCLKQTTLKDQQIYKLDGLVRELSRNLEDAGLRITELEQDNSRLRGDD